MKTIAWIYINTYRKLITLIMNCLWMILYFIKPKYKKLVVETRIKWYEQFIQSNPDTLICIKKILKEFKWKSDPIFGLIDWDPWPSVMIMKGLKDDCDGAAVLCKYLFNMVGLKAKNIILMSKQPFLIDSHVITIVYYPPLKQYLLYSNGNLFSQNLSKEELIDEYVAWQGRPLFNSREVIYYRWWIEVV